MLLPYLALSTISNGRILALVEGLSTCERLQCDTTVGYGGSPDESGETTLDALIVDGLGVRMGAVANLHRVKDAAKVAWAIMNYTKHTMLVGEAATKFAIQMGFKEETLTTNVSKKMMDMWKTNNCQPNFWQNVSPNPEYSCGPYKPVNQTYIGKNKKRFIDRFHHDTIGMVIIDSDRNVTAGTSTNGARYKIPGRVGDSPIPGSGAYALEGVGGAAATGDGDIMMRFLPSYQTVDWMRKGTKPVKAARKTLQTIIEINPKFQGAIIAADVNGRFGAACANLGIFKYSIGEKGKTRVESVPCI
uniref:N(4)-(beta-N-acetylglucosaminyl)-L-asparaginase n=1 Tax=Heterorhabditis bacteriophora TaxID=37862 RepID=A0A1I7XGM3_HETBA